MFMLRISLSCVTFIRVYGMSVALPFACYLKRIIIIIWKAVDRLRVWLNFQRHCRLRATTKRSEFDDSLKHKIIFVAGFLTRKYDTQSASDYDDDVQELTVSSDFTQQLNRGGLSIPKLSTVYFVHSAVHTISKVSTPKAGGRKYIATLLSYVDTPLSNNIMACRTVANVLLKAHVLHHSDREQALGCLRHREKLQWTVDLQSTEYKP